MPLTPQQRNAFVPVMLMMGPMLFFFFFIARPRQPPIKPKPNVNRSAIQQRPSIVVRPSAERQGVTWSVPELVGFLSKGLAVVPDRVYYTSPFIGTPVADLVKGQEVVLRVVRRGTPEEAKDAAAARKAEAHFAWGRFAISGREREVKAARKALDEKGDAAIKK
jgi:hypothetical protein